MNKKIILIAIGVIILIIGVALIIISLNLSLFIGHNAREQVIRDLTGFTLLCGIAVLVVGGIISVVGFSLFISSQPTKTPAITKSISPKSVALGNTPNEVQSVMGQPDKIIDLDDEVIHIYKDMKIIYVDGKVSDVQLS